MKLIKRVDPPCPCLIKVHEFYLAQADEDGNNTLGVGSIVECDCGQNWQLQDFRTQGKQWVRVGRDYPRPLANRDVITP